MKKLIGVFIVLVTLNVYADKTVINYGILIERADLIVEGQISEIYNGRYSFLIDEWIKGKSSKKVSVNIWEEWTCDERIEKHKIGQKLILILKKADGIGYDIFNQSTGELFIYPDNSIKTFQIPTLCENKEVLKNGIKEFMDSFDFIGEIHYDWEKKNERYFKRLISSNDLEKKIEQNSFFKWLVEKLEYYEIK